MGPIGWPELVIILIVVLLLFGTTRLAGLGKASGRAIREFKEETKDLRTKDAHQADGAAAVEQGQQSAPEPQPAPQQQPYQQQLPPGQSYQPTQPAHEVYDAEVVDPERPTN